MANFRDINSASRNLNRVTDINLQPENRSALESVMVALVAGGRVQEGALVAQMIEKTSVQTDIASAISDLKTVIQGIKPPETTHDDPNKHITPSELQQVMDRIAVLERNKPQ